MKFITISEKLRGRAAFLNLDVGRIGSIIFFGTHGPSAGATGQADSSSGYAFSYDQTKTADRFSRAILARIARVTRFYGHGAKGIEYRVKH